MEEKFTTDDQIVEESVNEENAENCGNENGGEQKPDLEALLSTNLDEIEPEKVLESAKLYQAILKFNFNHIEQLQKELQAKSEIEKKNDEYIRVARRIQHDFDNYKRNNAESVRTAEKRGIINTVEGILEIVDNFERAFKTGVNEETKGFELIYRQMVSFLTSIGVEEIQAVGEKLDVNYHNAILSIDSDKESGTIIEVTKKGYKLGENVIRYSQVIVAK